MVKFCDFFTQRTSDLNTTLTYVLMANFFLIFNTATIFLLGNQILNRNL